jgi:hypothetical protein
MVYSEFTLSRVRETFGLVVEEPKSLFLEILPTKSSDYLTIALVENLFDSLIKLIEYDIQRNGLTPRLFIGWIIQ